MISDLPTQFHTAWPSRRFTMVLLAGALTPSPLRQSLDMPVLCLSMDAKRTLLDLWLEAALSTPICEELVISLSSSSDARAVQQQITSSPILQAFKHSKLTPTINIVVDAVECRGPGGVLLETARHISEDDDRPVVVAEASTLPPHDLVELLDHLDQSVSGVIASSASHEPAGMYAFDADVISMLPKVAFLDLKEQVLPYLHERGKVILPMICTDRVIRLWSRAQYLQAVQVSNARNTGECVRRSAGAEIAETVRFSSDCVIGDEVVIEPDSIIHSSVIHRGAKIGAKSIVARSVIGPDAFVPPASVLKDSIVDRATPPAAARTTAPIRAGNGFAIRRGQQSRLWALVTGMHASGGAWR